MRLFIIFLLLTFTGPLLILFSKEIDLKADWRTAKRDSAEIAPSSKTYQQAIIQVYAARAFNWRGMFSVHTWIALKPAGAKNYLVCDVIGWRQFMKQPPFKIATDIPDRYWFNQKPKVILDIRGQEAEQLISTILKILKAYPFRNNYHYWPGPNSNTIIAFIGREVPQMRLVLPSNAIGKDYLTTKTVLAPAVSGTGYQLSINGLLGITVSSEEGLEINILGLVYGINPLKGIIKLPGFGDIDLLSFLKK